MADIPMLALWLVAILLWVEGIERDRLDLLVATGVAAGACVLTEYSGAAVIGLCALYVLVRHGVGRWVIALVPSVVIVVLYQSWSAGLYGQAHVSDAITYAQQERDPASLHGGLVALAYLDVPIGLGGTTVCNRCGAGFYSSTWGPLPYRVDPRPPERFDVFHILDAPARSPATP
jgi:hypothetical protein